MQTIALISQKGGCGKTTLAIHIASQFVAQGENAVILDLDPQLSSKHWYDERARNWRGGGLAEPPVMPVDLKKLADLVNHLRDIGTGVLVCDTAPSDETVAREAAQLADLVLVPCRPTITDLRAMARTAKVLRSIGSHAFAVITQVPPYAAAEDAEAVAAGLGLPTCPVRIGQRVAFSNCQIDGQVAREVEPGGKAAGEIARLHDWITAELGAMRTRTRTA